jgi:23S rRNA (guanosine2251-2'-O)-methyltransferase
MSPRDPRDVDSGATEADPAVSDDVSADAAQAEHQGVARETPGLDPADDLQALDDLEAMASLQSLQEHAADTIPTAPASSVLGAPPDADQPQRVVFGVRPVDEICRARPRDVAVVYVAEGHRAGEIDRAIATARDRAITVELRPRAFVAAIAGRNAVHQGIVALVGSYRYATVDTILRAATAAGEPPLIMLLDGVTDPHNLGAVIRSAEVLGGHGVIIPERGAAPVTGAVVKASAGATERVPVARVGHLLGVVDFLRGKGVRVLATAAGEGEALDVADLKGPVAFVLGSEGRGAREAVIRRCDGLIQIPQRGAVASLNVSVAGALLLYEATRQRRAG